MRTPRSTACRRISRRGAITVLTAVAIVMLMILSVFAINVAYMQMLRQQLRVATDSAAKAALISLGATQNQSTAQAFAQTVANHNLVGGQAISIPAGNIVFGNASKGSGSVYAFSAGTTPLNAARVTATANPSLFLSAFLPQSTFNTSQVSLTTRVSHDICLVLDRSASMAFDLSANEFSYPSDRSSLNMLWSYFSSPSPTASRWYALSSAVNTFVSTLQARNLDVHVALVTYAETYSFGTYSATEANLDVTLTSNYSSIVTAMNNYGANPLLGDTNIQAGMVLAQGELTSSRARSTADRTIILLTDGIPTSGSSNIAAITLADCQNSSIVTHVITFGAEASSGAAQTAMQSAASSGNGMYFAAPTAGQLTTAFTTIADSLPAVLIK
jgi:Ca-activated chloride channel family protein